MSLSIEQIIKYKIINFGLINFQIIKNYLN